MNPRNVLRTACECCEGRKYLTPVEIFNRPGLENPLWRVGTHARFKTSMLAGLSGKEALRALTTRRDDDVTVGLLDAWAAVLDVLTFYQARIGDEGFLRTAKERRSILELARLIGYELNPGVAASVRLAFTLDDSPGSPDRVVIPVGTRAQSLPAEQGELPQSFETGEEITAYPEWNALKLATTEPQLPTLATRTVWLNGIAVGLEENDRVLLRAADEPEPENGQGVESLVLAVDRVEVEAKESRTKVTLRTLDVEAVGEPGGEGTGGTVGRPGFGLTDRFFFGNRNVPLFFADGSLTFEGRKAEPARFFAAETFENTRFEIAGLELKHGLEHGEIVRWVNTNPPKKTPPAEVGLFAFDVETAPFGHNAPAWETLPKDWRTGAFTGRNWDEDKPVDKVPAVHENSGRKKYSEVYGLKPDVPDGEPPEALVLEGDHDDIEAVGWTVLETPGRPPLVTRTSAVARLSRADFGLSGKATRITVDALDTVLGKFKFRQTNVLAASRELTLAEEPLDETIQGSVLDVDRLLETPLVAGQTLALTGERADQPGIEGRELVVVAQVDPIYARGLTRLVLEADLEHPYKRATVRLNANVAPATHGESRNQVLGSGDGSAKFQRFSLSDKPLTFTPAPVPSGGESTLEVRVDGVRWRRAERFVEMGPDDRAYVLRRAADGVSSVLFGDGVHGARLPSGSENVRASYRVGTGLGGRVGAQRITLLPKKPLGVRSVVNPVAAEGGGEPEGRDAARENAPVTVLTLDRIVALKDFEDFARAYAGVFRARADLLREGLQRKVLVTVVPEGGGALGDILRTDLHDAMDAVRDPAVPLEILTFTPRLLRLEVKVQIHPDHLPETVLGGVEAALLDAFGFEAARLGRSVQSSRVHAVIHAVEGVVSADLDVFTLSSAGGVVSRLDARPAERDAAGALRGAQLLYLDPAFLEVERLQEVIS